MDLTILTFILSFHNLKCKSVSLKFFMRSLCWCFGVTNFPPDNKCVIFHAAFFITENLLDCYIISKGSIWPPLSYHCYTLLWHHIITIKSLYAVVNMAWNISLAPPWVSCIHYHYLYEMYSVRLLSTAICLLVMLKIVLYKLLIKRFYISRHSTC